MNDDLIKVAYGVGCIARLRQHGIDPVDFVNAAVASNDGRMKTAADAMLAVVHYSQVAPADTEKIAAVALEDIVGQPGSWDLPLPPGTDLMPSPGGSLARQAGDFMPDDPGMLRRLLMGAQRFAMKNPKTTAAGALGGAGLLGLGAGYAGNEMMQDDPGAIEGLAARFGV